MTDYNSLSVEKCEIFIVKRIPNNIFSYITFLIIFLIAVCNDVRLLGRVQQTKLIMKEEYSESFDLLGQGSSLPYYYLDFRFRESGLWSRSLRKFNQLFLVSLHRYPQNTIKMCS